MLYVQSHPDAEDERQRRRLGGAPTAMMSRVQQTNPLLFTLLTCNDSNPKSSAAKSRDGDGELERRAASSRRPSTDFSDEEFEQLRVEIHGYITQKIAQFRRTLQNRGHAVRELTRDPTPQTHLDGVARFPPSPGHRDLGCTAAVGRGPEEDQTRTFNSALMAMFKDAGDPRPLESVRRSAGTQHSRQAALGFDSTLRTHQDFTANRTCRLVYPHGRGDNTFVRSHHESFRSKRCDRFTQSYQDMPGCSLGALDELTASPETRAEPEAVSKVMLQQYWNGTIDNLRLFASTEYPQIMRTVAATCAAGPGILPAVPGTTWDRLTRTRPGSEPNHSSAWLQNKTLGHGHMDQGPAGPPSYRLEWEAAVKPAELHSVRGTTDFPGGLRAESALCVNQRRASLVEDQSAKRNVIVFGRRSEPARPELRSPDGEIPNTSVPTNQSEAPRRQEPNPLYEDISDAEKETPRTKLKEINSATPQYDDISDDNTSSAAPGPEPDHGPSEGGGCGPVGGPSCLVETNDGFEEPHLTSDCGTQTDGWKDQEEPKGEVEGDYVVTPISMLAVTFEPQDEDLDGTGTNVPEVLEVNPASPKPETSAPEAAAAAAAAFPPVPVFDTQECFLTAAQCESVVAVDLGPSSPERDSCDTDNSCEYSLRLERNYLTVPSGMFGRSLTPPSSEPDDGWSEEEDEGEESKDTQAGRTTSGKDKLCIMQNLSRLMKRQPKAKGPSVSESVDMIMDSDTDDEGEYLKRAKRKKKRVKTVFSSDSEGLIIISSDTEYDRDRKYRTPDKKRFFSSGPDQGGAPRVESRPIDGERESRPPSAGSRPPSAESSLPRHQSEPNDTPLSQSGPPTKPSVGSKSGRPRTKRRTRSKGKEVPKGSGKVLTKGCKADPERRSSSGSGCSGGDLPAKGKSPAENVQRLCGDADASPRQQEGTLHEDSPGEQPEGMDEDPQSTLGSNPVIPRLLVVKSFRPDGSLRLLKEPSKTSKVSGRETSSEMDKAHLVMAQKERFVPTPKPENKAQQTTSVPKPPPASRPHALPSQKGPPTSSGSLPSTSRQLPARQSPASSRHSSGDSHAPSRHSSRDSANSSRRLSGDSHASSRHLSGDGPTSSRHLSGDSPASSRHLSGDSPASSRHLSGDSPASSRHLSGDSPASSRRLSGDSHAFLRHLSVDSPASSRRLSGDSHASPRRLPGDSHVSSKHLSGDSSASSSVPRQPLSSSILRSQSYDGPALNRSPPKGPAAASSASTPPSVLARLRQECKETAVPTKRDRRAGAAPRRRRSSANPAATRLMKKTKSDAKQWTMAINRDRPKEKRPYVPEGYKWSQKSTKGPRRRSGSPSLIDKSQTDFPSHWDPNYF